MNEKEIFFPQKQNDMRIFHIFNEKAQKHHINQTFYVTNEGTIGIIIGLNKDLYEYFSVLEKELLKKMQNNRFDFEKWRAIKVFNFFSI